MATHKLALFRFVFVASRWLRERLTPAGLVIVALTAFAGAFGLDTQSNLAHMLFSLGASVVAVDAAAAVLVHRRAPRLSVRRHLPDFVTSGEPARYRIEVQNERTQPTRTGGLVEQLRQPWPSPTSLEHFRGAAASNRFDQRIGYPAFLEILRRLRAIDVERISMPPLLPGQRVDIEVAIRPTARGLAVFESLALVIPGPLGLVETRVPVNAGEATLAVLPTRLPVELPPAASHRLLQPGGIALAQHVATPRSSVACATTARAIRCGPSTGAASHALASRWCVNSRRNSSRGTRCCLTPLHRIRSRRLSKRRYRWRPGWSPKRATPTACST